MEEKKHELVLETFKRVADHIRQFHTHAALPAYSPGERDAIIDALYRFGAGQDMHTVPYSRPRSAMTQRSISPAGGAPGRLPYRCSKDAKR